MTAPRPCLDCERPIPAKRLAEDPDALRCLHCQTVLDIRDEQFRAAIRRGAERPA